MTGLPADRQNLVDARESLSYWTQRAQRLPMRAVRKRREARMLARRWSARVAEAERAHYGAGVLGALLMVLVERRLPEPSLQARHCVARWARRAFAAAAVALVALTVMAMLAAVELIAAILEVLS